MRSGSPAAHVNGRTLHRRGELQDRVVAQIRRGLMAGAFVPGQVISLRKLAHDLGTSPMPVREALNQLTAANALQILPNRSVCVPKLSPEQFAELNRVRQALEGMAAQTACQNATPALIRRLEKINRAMVRAIETRNVMQCLAQNQSFHFALYQAANSELILSLIESLWLRCGPMMYFSLVSPDITWNASQHRELLKALRNKDPAGARRAIERDIRTTANYLLNSSVFNGHSGPLAVLRDVRAPGLGAPSV